MKVARTNRFRKAWDQLTEDQKTQARKAVKHLTMDLRYPALNVKKMQGTKQLWEARVSRSLRLTFQISGDVLVLRNIGYHDETLKHP